MNNPIFATFPSFPILTMANPIPSLPDGKPGALFIQCPSAEMNSACGKVLLRKTLVTRHLARQRGLTYRRNTNV